MKYKQNIIYYINLLVCIFIFIMFVYWQKDICLIRHDFFLPFKANPYEWLAGRIPASILNFITVYYLPKILLIHVNDFLCGFVSLIKAIPLFLIGIIAVKCFLLNHFAVGGGINFLKKPESSLILILSLLFLFYGNINYPLYLFNIRETTVFYEYSFGVIFYFLFYYLLLRFILEENYYNTLNKNAKVLIYLICFFCGFWNEHINCAVFYSLISIFVLFLIFDKEKFLKKELLHLVIPFFIGFIMYYICSDYVLSGFNETAGHDFNIKQNLSIISTYLSEFNKGYFKYMFYLDKFTYLFIFVFSLFVFMEKTKQSKFILITCFSILLGHLITCYSYVFFIEKIYTRESLIIFHSLILAFILIILLGELYNSNKSKIIKSAIIIFLIWMTFIYGKFVLNNYSDIINKNSYVKQCLYKLDEINLIYNILGESAILPISIFYDDIYKSTKIFIFQDDIEDYSSENYKKYLLNRYFSEFYTGYNIYFNKLYGKDLIGFYVVDDETAYKELQKRKDIINNFLPYNNQNSSNKLNFNDLFKYKDININIQKINLSKETDENKYLLIKAKAFIEYKKHHYTSAIIFYNEYLTKYPDDYDALINLGQIYMNMENLQKAEKLYEILHNKDSHNIDFLLRLFLINFKTKKDYETMKSYLTEIKKELDTNSINGFRYKKKLEKIKL